MNTKFLWRKFMAYLDFAIALVCISYLCSAIENRGWGDTWWGFGIQLGVSTIFGLGCFFNMIEVLCKVYKDQREFKKAARK